MPAVLEQIDRMTPEERILTMDHLWMRIVQSAGDYPAPEWHGRVLAETERRIESGKSTFTPWEEAKDEIRAALA